MANLYNTFERMPSLKRKCSYQDDDDFETDDYRQNKRSNLAHLPIRTSPKSSHNRTWQNDVPDIQRPLTPVDSSDDEAYGQAYNAWSHSRSTISTAPRHSDSTDKHDAMDLSSFFTPTRKQTNSIPQRQINLMFAGAAVSEGRVATPIKATFNIFEQTQPKRGRQLTRHTMLSPVMNEEPFLPSPVEPNDIVMDADPETTSRMEHASDGFGALSVACRDDDVMADIDLIPNEHRTADPTGGRGGTRKAKLHMGFRADCEKCQQRVPGHYSHIIWS